MTEQARTFSIPVLALLCAARSVAGCSNTAPPSSTDAGYRGPPIVCDAPPAEGLPPDVYCTGLYEFHDPASYARSALPYTPGVTLWSDGAEKHRYFALPPGATIDTSDMDVWKFPVGTKAWKEFRFDGKLVETRLFWKRDEVNWASGTYVWNDAGTEAALYTPTKALILPSGYEVPTAKDCGKCHHGGADKLLGIEAAALALPTTEGVTLDSLVKAGALSNPPPMTSGMLPEDASGKAGAALGYLHANCGMPCHSTRGLGEETKLVLRLRAGEVLRASSNAPTALDAKATDIYAATVGQSPTTASVAQQFPSAKRITPGSHDESLVWLLSHRRGTYQMPPLVSHVVDDAGTLRLSAWIDALTP
jgi:hypothetical protein